MNIWFTADPHFSHDNIIKYCNRPFKNSEEMNNMIIKNINIYVKETDVLYIVGDLGWDSYENMKSIISKINCKTKILIKGNHDKKGIESYYSLGFSAVLESAEIKVGKRIYSISHFPQKSIYDLIMNCKFHAIKAYKKWKSIAQVFNIIKRELNWYSPISDSIRICGHVHNSWKIKRNNINVGVDVNDFKPISLKQIIKLREK